MKGTPPRFPTTMAKKITNKYNLLIQTLRTKGWKAKTLITTNVQDWSLQCPSKVIWSFKIYLSQNNSSKHNFKLKIKMSLEVLNIVYPSSIVNYQLTLASEMTQKKCMIPLLGIKPKSPAWHVGILITMLQWHMVGFESW